MGDNLRCWRSQALIQFMPGEPRLPPFISGGLTGQGPGRPVKVVCLLRQCPSLVTT